MNQPRPPVNRVALALVIVSGLALAGLALWKVLYAPRERAITPAVLGTTSRLVAVGKGEQLTAALAAAQEEIEQVNRLMSTRDPDSVLSRFNDNTDPAVGPDMLAVVRFGQSLAQRTGGAFDITVMPLVRLWAKAGQQGALPIDEELAHARALVGYARLGVPAEGDGPLTKAEPAMQITLDAIAKGYAVDRAIEAMRAVGLSGAMVEIGGDLRCFGRPADRGRWRIGVQSPWYEGEQLMTIGPTDPAVGLAVCTSGNYRRFVQIGGKHYSHIIDPRTGAPADAVPSVTVIAPDAMTADGWATALSVLGVEEGLKLVERQDGIEALLVTGTPDAPKYHPSSGFNRYVIAE